MAIDVVKFTLNGQTYDLTYNSASGAYEATISAPTVTSWNQTNHMYAGSVTAKDTAGNETTATVSDFSALGLRVLEKTAPTITVTYPTSGAYLTTAQPTFLWNVTDAGSGIDLSTLSVKLDSGSAIKDGFTTAAITNGYSVEYTPSSALGEGTHTVYLNVSDNDGNAAVQKSVTFTVDTVPPTLNITSPADGFITNNSTATVSGTTNDATSSPVTLTVNGENVTVAANGSFSTTVALTEGTNEITIVATDSAGKSTTVTRVVTLDTSEPTIVSVTLAPNPVDVGASYTISVKVTD